MNDTDLPSLTPNLSSFGEGGVGGGTLPQTCVDWFNFDSMGDRYKKFHGHIALVVCIFGTVANILNVIVLTRKDMSTPINRMLTALAVADMVSTSFLFRLPSLVFPFGSWNSSSSRLLSSD